MYVFIHLHKADHNKSLCTTSVPNGSKRTLYILQALGRRANREQLSAPENLYSLLLWTLKLFIKFNTQYLLN